MTTITADGPSDLVVVHDAAYRNWIFDHAHPTQGRRFAHGFTRIGQESARLGLRLQVQHPAPAERSDLERVHSPSYIAEVLDTHHCDEWLGARPDLAALAQSFVGGTLIALRALLDGQASTAVHLPGAKHHAQRDHSSGFCVFGDFAIAALVARESGIRTAILDIDAHHGDGTENLLYDYSDILTYSIHQYGIFPGTGFENSPDHQVFNRPLAAGDGDEVLASGVEDFIEQARSFAPDLIFVAAGADGLLEDPLTALEYSVAGLGTACARVRAAFPERPILMGGAGGYLPDSGTPQAWASMAVALAGADAELLASPEDPDAVVP